MVFEGSVSDFDIAKMIAEAENELYDIQNLREMMERMAESYFINSRQYQTMENALSYYEGNLINEIHSLNDEIDGSIYDTHTYQK